MRRMFIAAAIIVTLLLSATVQASQSRETTHGWLFESDGVKVLRLRGTPEQRGRSHGALLAREVMEMVNSFLDAGFGRLVEKRIMPVLDEAFAWPDHVDLEIDGIVEGIETVLSEEERTVRHFKRPLSKRDLLAFNALGDWLPFACSSFTFSGAKGTFCGRNFDYVLPPKALKHQMVIAHETFEGRKSFYTVGFPGLSGAITFMNSDRVFGAIHDVGVKPAEITSGNTPRLVTLRMIAEQAGGAGAVETALRICRENRTLYGNIFHVAARFDGRTSVGVIEYDFDRPTEGGASLRKLADGCRAIWNTNHFRLRSRPEQCKRYDLLAEALESADAAEFDLASAREAIAKATVMTTMHQSLADLKNRRMMLALQQKMGVPANRSRFSTLEWDALLGVSPGKGSEEEEF